jgi:hypothetical protein
MLTGFSMARAYSKFITMHTTVNFSTGQQKYKHYQNRKLPWRLKTAKKYRFTAKVILGSRPPSKARQV